MSASPSRSAAGPRVVGRGQLDRPHAQSDVPRVGAEQTLQRPRQGDRVVHDALSVGASIDYGWVQNTSTSPSAKWYGVALYGTYALNDQFHVSVRPEYLADKDGYLTGAPAKRPTLLSGKGTRPTRPRRSPKERPVMPRLASRRPSTRGCRSR